MYAKTLTIAAALVIFLMGAGTADAQDAAAPADPAATAAPADAAPAPDPFGAPAPDVAAPSLAPETAIVENPYGLTHLWEEGDMVSKGILFILGVMSLGTWYIFVTKYWEQARVLGHAKVTEKKFWTAANLEDGIEKLGKNNVFRNVAERGQQAMARQGGMLSQADWVQMSLARAVDEENARLAGGISFLASVGSTSPFVGLFGTVWGILNALTAIGVAG